MKRFNQTFTIGAIRGTSGPMTPITLETTYGLDIETDFISGETIERFQADVKLSNGEYRVVLELRS